MRFHIGRSTRFVRIVLPLLLLYTTLLLGACGDSNTTTSARQTTNTKLDACNLLTQTAAAAALGEPVKEAGPRMMEHEGDASSAAVSDCHYATVDTASGKSISLLVRRSPLNDNTPAMIAQVRATTQELGTKPEDVAGVGDTAFWNGTQLNVFKGTNFYMIVSIRGFNDKTTALEKAKAVAQATLAQL